MSHDGFPFEERAARARLRREDGPDNRDAGAAQPAESAGSPAEAAPAPAAAPSQILKDLRQDVRATIDEWLTERSSTVSLAVAQIVEDALRSLQQAHAARLLELESQHEARLAALERDHADALRSARRRRRASMRATERELREKIERLERSLTAASLEGVDRLRDVERREADRRRELEQAHHARLLEKDAEIDRLQRAVSGDQYYDSLHDQLLSRRPESGGEQH